MVSLINGKVVPARGDALLYKTEIINPQTWAQIGRNRMISRQINKETVPWASQRAANAI